MNKWILSSIPLVILVLFFSTYGGLTATPKFWHDEAVPFEIARNLTEYGTPDLAVAPGIFWQKGFMTHATGFPLTLPLAGVFKIFGVGVAQSRLLMIVWMLAMLATLFFVIRAFFDQKTAFFSVLLIATFSSFYANGRTGTGEIPGFLFLLMALYFLYQRNWYGWGGLFAALAAVTKPSMYLFVLPVMVLEILIKNCHRPVPNQVFSNANHTNSESPQYYDTQNLVWDRSAARKAKMLGLFLIGTVPVLLTWLWLINPAPFSLASWQEMIAFYQNAFNAPSLISQFPTVIPHLLTHSTIIYFLLLFIPIFIAWHKNLFTPAQNRFILFLFLYGAVSFFYFLRSPGWFRYLLGTELLILTLLPTALQKEELWRNILSIFTGLRARAGTVRARPSEAPQLRGEASGGRESEGEPSSQLAGLARKVKMLSMFLLVGITIIQSAQYLLGAEIPSGTKSIEIAEFLNKEILAKDSTATIGIVDNSPIAALIPAYRKYQRTLVGNNAPVGAHPLSLPPEQFPTYLLALKKNDTYQNLFEQYYKPFAATPFRVIIYKKTSR
ncbi:MAG: glycosyltransferase family 39 protein [Patescibacteria group bacterium]